MRIHHIRIERFRGIRLLDWRVPGGLVCLLGPGDSTKSTILDAVDYTLAPRRNIDFDDADFYDLDTTEPIEITVTVGPVPESLKRDDKFGMDIRGWGSDGLHDEPEDEDELVLSVRLRIEPSLDATWAVVNDRNTDGRAIWARTKSY